MPSCEMFPLILEFTLSGRTLRKLPFIAHALFVRKTAPTTLSEFLVALGKAVDRQREERNHLAESS
jgi:hypothetical protein